MKRNKGFTLVELLVVVVIIGILTGVGVTSVSSVNATSAKKAAAQIDAYLSVVRTKCMSRAGSPYALIYSKNGTVVGEYYENSTLVSEDVVSDKRVSVTYSYGTYTNTALPTTRETALKISFSRATGALKLPVTNGGELAFGITGGRRTYTVTVIAVTGDHDIS